MLEIRPNCEYCNKDLAHNSTEAMICTYECTFCKDCVDNILENVCPNCGGGFTPRPIRPINAWRKGLSIEHQPASKKRILTKFSLEEIKDFSSKIKNINTEDR